MEIQCVRGIIRCPEFYVGNKCFDVQFSCEFHPDKNGGIKFDKIELVDCEKYHPNGDIYDYKPTLLEEMLFYKEINKILEHSPPSDVQEIAELIKKQRWTI